MRKTNKRLQIISGLLLCIALSLPINYSFAGIIRDENGKPIPWSDAKAKDAYRPNPILFCHGFASGGPLQTWVEREGQKENQKPKLDEKLAPYFNYYNVDPVTKQPIKALKDFTRIPYLGVNANFS